MSKIDLNGSIGSLLSFYKHERNIYGRCPHCGDPFRLSEVKLSYGKEPPRDVISRLKADRDKLREKIEGLNSEIEQMEEDHEIEIENIEGDWHDRVELQVDKRLISKEKEIRQKAVAQSRASQLGKTLEKMAPMLPGFGHHPSDVRPIFDPIDFIVFDGYFQGNVTGITFVEFKTGNSRLTPIQNSIQSAVIAKRVRFEERRLTKDAMKMLTDGKPSSAQRSYRRLVE